MIGCGRAGRGSRIFIGRADKRSDTLGNGCDLNLRPEGAREFPMPAETMIECESLTKRFGHFTAVVEA
jgi:hypothetical protein